MLVLSREFLVLGVGNRINAIEGQVQQIGQAVHRAEAKADATQNQLEGLFASQMQKIEALLRKPSSATRSRSRGE